MEKTLSRLIHENTHINIREVFNYGGGGWNAIRYKIVDPLKIKYQISDHQKNQISDITRSQKKSDIWSLHIRQQLCVKNKSKWKKFHIDEDGIRTHAGKPQWISSPSP